MYQEQVPSYKHLDEPLYEGRFVFECILAGNLQAFTTCRLSFHCSRDCTVHLFGLTFFCSCYKINCSFLVLLLRGFIPGITLSWINPKVISLVLC